MDARVELVGADVHDAVDEDRSSFEVEQSASEYA
jgi:hypothetical protein